MKKLLSLFVLICFSFGISAQVSKTLNLQNAGTLSSTLTVDELNTVTNLTITGNIDARDFKTMRDLMPMLADIDLSGATIVEYNGPGGTNGNSSYVTFNQANTVPIRSFSANPPYSYSAKNTLTSITLPSTVTTIKSEAFTHCSNLRSINFPSSLSRIEAFSFLGCSSLENVNLSSMITSIGTNAFTLINVAINVNQNNPNYSSIDGVLYNKNQTTLIQCPISKTGSFSIPFSVSKIGTRAFYYCTGLTSIDIPSSVTVFENGDVWNCGAFYACSGISSINIPASVTEIGRETFAECLNITSIYVNTASPVDLSSSPEVFANIDKLNARLYVPFGTKNLYVASNQWKDFQNIVEMEPVYEMPLEVTAGGLATLLPQAVRDTLTYLALTGTINAHDFFTMRDMMPALANIDLSGVLIVASSTLSGDEFFLANEIPRNAFYNSSILSGKQTLTTCILPSTLTTIGTGAFSNCVNLSEVTIPSSVTEINARAFQFCSGLNSLTFISPSSLVAIGYSAFGSCSGLTSVDLPTSLITIDNMCFENCSGLNSISIPSNVTSIGAYAFQNCTGLNEVYAYPRTPQTPKISWINDQIFSNSNQNACTLYVPIGTYDLYAQEYHWKNFKTIVEMPELYLSANALGFGENGGIAEVNLSCSSAWEAKSNQIWLTLNPTSGGMGSNTLNFLATSNPENTARIATVTVTATGLESQTIVVTQYGKVEVTAGGLKDLLDNQLSSITKLTLTGTIDARDFKTMRDLMPMLAEIDLSGVTIAEYNGTEGTAGTQLIMYTANEVPRNAFYNNLKLLSVGIPLSAKTIGRSAFNNCDGLTQVTFGANSQLTTIGYLSFAYCDKLTEIQIPSNVTLIDYGAFRQCSVLVTCNLPESVKSIGNGAFNGCYVLKNISLPQSVETIGEYAFYSCKEILNFNIPASTISIGRGVFIDATGYIVVDENNLSYSSLNGVLYDKNKTQLIYCPPSTSGDFVIPESVSSIAVDAFYNCSDLTSIDIPDGLTTMEDWVFENCTGLSNISLPQSLTSIGSYSFYNCSGLTTLIIKNPTPVDLSATIEVFYNINMTNCILYIPFGSKAAYQSANQWKDFQNIVEMPGISLSDNAIDMYANVTSKTINITSNIEWTAISNQSWLTLSPNSANGSQALNLVATANQTGLTRSAIVTISATGVESQTIVVTQLGIVIQGNSTVYGLASTAPNRRAIPVTFNENGTINSISVYHNGGSGNILLGVYTDVAGKPASRLGVTSLVAVNAAEGWQTVALANPVSVSSGQKVWLSFVFQNSVAVRYEAGTPGRAMSSQTWSAGMPDNFGTSGVSNYNFSVYCNYTPVEVNEKPLGNTVVYSTTSTAANRRAIPVTFNENGEINSISVYHNGGSGNMLLGVYTDVAGKPAQRLGVTSSVAVNAAEGWQTVALANPVSVSSGQKVWLSFVFQNSVAVRYEAGTPGRAMSSQTWSAGMPDEFGVSGVSNYNFSVYCNYTPVEISEKPLGNTVVYNTNSTAANRRAIPVTFNENGEINSISVYHNGGSGNMLLGIYNDVAGKPASRLGVTSSVTVNAAEGWQTVALASQVSVSSGQKVWLSFVFQNSVAVRYEAGTPGRAMSSQTWSAGMPDEFGASGVSNYNFSVYCNYTPVEISEKPLGNTVVYNTTSTAANRRAIPVTFNENGEINSISVYHNGGAGNLLLGVYIDVAGKPASRLGVTSSVAVNAAEGWQTVALANPVSVSSGQKVWLSFVFQNSVAVRYEAGTPGRAMSSQTWSAGMPDEFGASGVSNYNFSVYCNYTPVSAGLSKSGQFDDMVTETIDSPIGEANELKVYPNPFSQKLNFEFVSARNANAILEIYNLNGQLIAKLLDQQVPGGVLNRIEYTPNEIISGMYIYKLNLDGNISVGKVIYRK